MSNATTEEKANESRWWEFYAVRYFVGTVIGAAIILYLNTSEISPIKGAILPGIEKDLSSFDVQQMLLLAALGLAYCYVSSAPILVFHATRCVFLNTDTKLLNRWTIGTLAVIVLAATVLFHLPSPPQAHTILVLVLFGITFSFQLILLCLSLSGEGKRMRDYYESLTKARSDERKQAKQYIESYRHLREHGNAFLIIIFELVLGLILNFIPSANLAIVVLIAWIFPAALVWLAGSVLEYNFMTRMPPP